MYYHFAILLLFRPLIKLRIVGSSISPRDVCLQAADAISGLLRSYSQLYTLRRTPSFVPYFVLTSSIMHLAIGAAVSGTTQSAAAGESTPGVKPPQQLPKAPAGSPRVDPRVAEAIARGIADLSEMAPCHFFAEQALNILRFLAKKWNIEVDVNPTPTEGRPSVGTAEQIDSTRPVTSSLNFFSPNVTNTDFNCSWGKTIKPASSAQTSTGAKPASVGQMVDVMENPLFWPFPMQGRPILPTGDGLEKAGFELI